MTWQVVIMFGVATIFALIGVGLLLALIAPRSQGQVYAFRMIGVMALAAGIVLGASACGMWYWGTPG